MHHEYPSLITRYLRDDERLILSQEKEMPLVLEAKEETSCEFLQNFLAANSTKLIDDLARHGAILLRGFAITSDSEFEQTLLSIPEFRGISEAFMSENGRDHPPGQDYVLMTNSVYKTGGTLYLGGFHTENYYSADVPSYLSFCCFEPSKIGGETGLINCAKLYYDLDESLKTKLENKAYYVSQWLVSEVVERYQISPEKVEAACERFELPRSGSGKNRLILMYKPSVFQHPITREKALQINLFELPTLNNALRKCFMEDYQGKTWFWHRFFWKLPNFVFNFIENTAVMLITLFNSPKKSYQILRNKWAKRRANKTNQQHQSRQRVGSCFDEEAVKALAKSMRNHYCSCLWQKGDILLVDNKKVMHAGMPGEGSRLVRALIANPVSMPYFAAATGCIDCSEGNSEGIGDYLAAKEKSSLFADKTVKFV